MEGLPIIAFFPGALVLHWFLLESWWAWALTAPVVALAGFGYMLFTAAQVGPGRASDLPCYASASTYSPVRIYVSLWGRLRRRLNPPPRA